MKSWRWRGKYKQALFIFIFFQCNVTEVYSLLLSRFSLIFYYSSNSSVDTKFSSFFFRTFVLRVSVSRLLTRNRKNRKKKTENF